MQRCPNARSGFTLIELLVVIAIIIILVGLLFPAFRGVQNQAKRVQAKNDLTQIMTAVNAFYTEYGKYPVNVASGNTSDAYFGAAPTPAGATSYANNDILFDVLRNNIGTVACPAVNAALVQLLNPRAIVFLDVPPVKSNAKPVSGVIPNCATGLVGNGRIGVWYDPWGSPYSILIDTNYDNQVTNPYAANTGAGSATLTTGAIAWSLGADGVQGTTDFRASDDVISWQ